MTRNQKVIGTVAFDFDGTLTENPHYAWPVGPADFSLIRQAQARGYAVAVMTCNTVRLVAAELRRHGFRALADEQMSRHSWHDPEVILVTNRKIAASLYADDKAVRYRYGQPASVVLDLLDAREGFRACPHGRHWGPHGGAGVIPFTVFRGRLYVLLGLRSRHVNHRGTWAGFGGALEHAHEDTWEAATRELHEETGGLQGNLCDWADYYVYECEGCGWRYVTFLAEVPCTEPEDGEAAWLPEVRVSTGRSAFETDQVAWVRAEDVEKRELHPGFAEAWPSLRRQLAGYCGLAEVSAA